MLSPAAPGTREVIFRSILSEGSGEEDGRDVGLVDDHPLDRVGVGSRAGEEVDEGTGVHEGEPVGMVSFQSGGPVIRYREPAGEVAEWSNASVSKTDMGASPSRVRIPPSPLKFQQIQRIRKSPRTHKRSQNAPERTLWERSGCKSDANKRRPRRGEKRPQDPLPSVVAPPRSHQDGCSRLG